MLSLVSNSECFNLSQFSILIRLATHLHVYSIGPRSSNLGQDMLLKLKAVYTLMEQLYTGTQRTLVAMSNGKQPPPLLRELLDKLSVMPPKLEEIK